MQKLKTAFIFMTCAIMLVFVTQDAQAIELIPGDLIKSPSNTAVYELGEDFLRHPFPYQKVYEDWYGLDFSAVMTLTDEELASYTMGKTVSFKPGSVVKFPTLPQVYEVTGLLELTWIPSEDEMYALGVTYDDVFDISELFYTDYTIIEEIISDPEPEPIPDPTPDPEPEPDPEPIEFSVLSRSFTPTDITTGEIRVKTSDVSTVSLSYNPEGSGVVKTQLADELDTSHSFDLSGLASGTKYEYTLVFENSSKTISIEETGTFVSYYDIYLSAHGDAPTDGSLVQDEVEVGKFFVYNNTNTQLEIRELWLEFVSPNRGSDKISKTVRLINDTPSSDDFGKIISYKSIGSESSLRGGLNKVRFDFLASKIEPSTQNRYSIVIDGLDNIGTFYQDGEEFKTYVDYVLFSGDPEVYTKENHIGTKYHTL